MGRETDKIERRRYPRFITTMAASIFNDSVQPIKVQVQNMSAGGILFYSPIQLQCGHAFSLITPSGEVWTATVVACDPARDDNYAVRGSFRTCLLHEAVDIGVLLESSSLT